MNKKNEANRRAITVKFRVSRRELTRLQSRANQFTDGNVSELIRHAVDNMSLLPKSFRR